VEEETTSVLTRMTFAAPPDQIWQRLLFYEQVDQPPPLDLRLLLPVPMRTEGSKSRIGDEARCLYTEGHLVKRVTQVETGRHYGFEIVEQALAIGRGIRLSGGAYTLREIPGGRTEVTLATRYVSPRRPRWLWRRIEAAVCHRLHRHILRAMERDRGLRRAR
jgi:hypothetical protein